MITYHSKPMTGSQMKALVLRYHGYETWAYMSIDSDGMYQATFEVEDEAALGRVIKACLSAMARS